MAPVGRVGFRKSEQAIKANCMGGMLGDLSRCHSHMLLKTIKAGEVSKVRRIVGGLSGGFHTGCMLLVESVGIASVTICVC